MTPDITEFPLSRFEELVPLLMRCFPDFWGPRLERGMRSFPYDLRLFTASLGERMIGCIGLHDYPFLLEGGSVFSYGVSDVAVDPDHRGRGYSLELQRFVLNRFRGAGACGFLPLYTEKPGVYQRLGWKIYESDRSGEISISRFPKGKTFRPEARDIRCKEIQKIYNSGRTFPGKCLRSEKTWLELFSDPEYEWQLEGNTYYLYRGEVLYEAYSSDPAHPVSGFTPRHGGHDSNKVMVNFSKITNPTEEDLAAVIDQKQLVFPAADVF